jgi:hypothetical protein
MTAAQFRAWLDRHFPFHASRSNGSKRTGGGMAEAAEYLKLSVRAVRDKRDGRSPITERDLVFIERKKR